MNIICVLFICLLLSYNKTMFGILGNTLIRAEVSVQSVFNTIYFFIIWLIKEKCKRDSAN